MSEQDEARLRRLLEEYVSPMADVEAKRDLWPMMLDRLDRRDLRVPWFDWVMAAAVAILLLLAPESVVVLLYQL